MLKNKVSRVIALVATVCCLGGAAAGLTAFAVNATNSSTAKAVASASSELSFTVEEPKGVRLKTTSTGGSSTYFSYYAGKTNRQGVETSGLQAPTAPIRQGYSSITAVDSGDSLKYTVKLAESADISIGWEFYYDIKDASINSVIFNTETPGFYTEQSAANTVIIDYESEWTDVSPDITCVTQKAKYTLTFSSLKEAYFASDNQGTRLRSASVEAGSDYEFYLVASDDRYSIENAKVYSGENEVTLAAAGNSGTIEGTQRGWKKYTLKNVSGPVTITAENVSDKIFTVTYPTESQDYTISGPKEVIWNNSVTFSIRPKDGKEVTKVSYTMGEDGSETSLELSLNNSYTITPVTGNVEIIVEVNDSQYSITFPATNSQIGYTITKNGDEDTPLAGLVTEKYGDLKFKISLKPGYTGKPEVTFVPTSGQAQPLSEADGVYTLKVTSNGTINVDGITQETYTVTVNDEDLTHYHYTPSGSTTNLTYGSTFHFTVEADNGYSFDGYTIVAKKGEDSVVVTPAAGSKQKTNFSFTVEGNVTVTIKEKADAAQTFTVSSDSSNTHCTIKVGENVLGTEGNDKVKFNSQFSFTVDADDGYTVTGVYVGNSSVLLRDGTYTTTVTGPITIHVVTVENTLTVTYMNSSGEPSSPQNYTYTDLAKESGVSVPSADTYALGGPFTYLVAHWYKDGTLYTDEKFASSLIAAASTSITLNCRYDFNTEKSAELLETFTAKYRDDNEGADGWSKEKSYLIVKLAIDGEEWKLFLDELNTLGASLTAVGFTYSNAPNGVLGYTEQDISEKIANMTLATGNDIGQADEKSGNNGAVSRLYGYRWDKAGVTQENQVQFIKGIDANVTRYVGGWFAVTINGVRTVIKGDLKRVEGTPAEKKPAPVEAVLNESAPTYGSDEEPTIE